MNTLNDKLTLTSFAYRELTSVRVCFSCIEDGGVGRVPTIIC